MKLTQWELERILEAIDLLIAERADEGRGIGNHHRLRNKVTDYAQKTGRPV